MILNSNPDSEKRHRLRENDVPVTFNKLLIVVVQYKLAN